MSTLDLVATFLLGGVVGWLVAEVVGGIRWGRRYTAQLDAKIKAEIEAETEAEAEAETDRFLTALGTTYREELARKIADEADSQLVDVEHEYVREIVYRVALKILSEGDSSNSSPELCGHIGYPFGEPPAMFCDLPAGHPGDHESANYKHAEI
jgi:hypothetical protein